MIMMRKKSEGVLAEEYAQEMATEESQETVIEELKREAKED